MKVSNNLSNVIKSEETLIQTIQSFSNSGAGVIHVRTREVWRAVTAIRNAVLLDNCVYKQWDVINGLRTYDVTDLGAHPPPDLSTTNFSDALGAPEIYLAEGHEDQGVEYAYFLYANPQHWFEGNPLVEYYVQQYANILAPTSVRVILVTDDSPMPDHLEEIVAGTRFSSPTHSDLKDSLARVLEGVGSPQDSGITIRLSGEDIDKVCFAAAGMGLDVFEMYVSLAIVNASMEHDEITVDHLLEGIAEGKTEVVNKNDILELYKPAEMSSVGGMENLKEWVRMRSRCFSDEAKEFGIDPPKGIVVVGIPGCIHGDTEITYLRGARKGGRKISLHDLYHKFNGLAVPGGGRGRSKPWRDLSLPTYTHSITEDGVVYYNRILGVIDSGKKALLSVTFSNGTVLKMSHEHPVLSEEGVYVRADNLKVGDRVVAKGSMRPQAGDGRTVVRDRVTVNLKYHKYGGNHTTNGYRYNRVARARLVIEAHMNGMEYADYVHCLKHNPQAAKGLKFLDPQYHVHHLDDDTMNDDLSNLMVLHRVEHAREHGDEGHFNVEYTSIVEVTGIEDVGVLQTYDIAMDAPDNNFSASGIFTHNTGKSLVAKSVAGELGVPLVRLDFGRVFNSLVGQSEERMRTALRMVEDMAPICVLADEIDKGLGGIGGSGDSGTSSRVLGTFLTWLQETTAPAFVIVTANNITGLPPELLRRGRFDNIFATGFPTVPERLEVLDIHLKKRGWNPLDYSEKDRMSVAQAATGYVPAEIEQAVKDGLVAAFSEGEDLEMHHIVQALKEMTPMSVTYADTIAKMAIWSKQNATPASKTYDAVGEDGKVTAISQGRTRVRTRNRKSTKLDS